MVGVGVVVVVVGTVTEGVGEVVGVTEGARVVVDEEITVGSVVVVKGGAVAFVVELLASVVVLN